jgi:hypothetical protein
MLQFANINCCLIDQVKFDLIIVLSILDADSGFNLVD